MSAAILKAGKAALALLSDGDTRKTVGWVTAVILSPLILLAAVLISFLSTTTEHNRAVIDLCFHGGDIPEKTPENTSKICAAALRCWTAPWMPSMA